MDCAPSAAEGNLTTSTPWRWWRSRKSIHGPSHGSLTASCLSLSQLGTPISQPPCLGMLDRQKAVSLAGWVRQRKESGFWTLSRANRTTPKVKNSPRSAYFCVLVRFLTVRFLHDWLIRPWTHLPTIWGSDKVLIQDQTMYLGPQGISGDHVVGLSVKGVGM